MSDTKISALAAGSDADGTELLPAVQGGSTIKLSVSQLLRRFGLVDFDPTQNYVAGTLGFDARLRVHVKQFAGLIGDGVADDTSVVQAALAFMSIAGGRAGGILEAEGCKLRLTSRITIPSWVLFRGASWLPDPSNGAHIYHTCLFIDWGAGQDNHAVEMSHSSGIEGFTMYWPGQAAKTATTPVQFGFGISTPTTGAVCDNIHVKDITFYNAYQGLRLNSSGRWRVKNIQGDVLLMGFTADLCEDVCYLDGVHFWDFYTQGDVLETWVMNNGTGFDLRRIDQLFFDDLFVWNHNIGVYFHDQCWATGENLTVDRANYPVIVEAADQITVDGFTLTANANTRPCIWGKSVSHSARFSNGRVTDASSVGVQIDDGTLYQFDNVDFDCPHASVVNRSLTTDVRISDTCRWNVPPMGAWNTRVNGHHLPRQDQSVPLPTPTLGGAAAAISGGFSFPLTALTAGQVDWDLTYIGQRCGLYTMEFDLVLNGATLPTTWYFQFRVSQDTGSNIIADYSPLAPLILNAGATTKVRIPFHINHARYKTIARFTITPTVVVAGGSVNITNVTLYEQNSQAMSDAQIGNMFVAGYCLDPYGKGQTVAAKGLARRIITQPESGIGRTDATPTSGTWYQLDEILVDAPTAGASPGVVCVGGGTFGTGGPPVFKALPALGA